MAIIIYGSSISPFVRKTRVTLAEKGVPYTLEPINPFTPPPEFLTISPLKRIPVMRDTDVAEPNTLPDSSIICSYLEQKFPTPPLYPKDTFQRGRAMWLEEYADSHFAGNLVRPFFFERVLKKMMKQETDETVCTDTKAKYMAGICDYLEQELGDHEFFVGDAFSIADISVATMFVNMKHSGEEPDAASHPKLAAYVKRLYARPSFKAMIDEETPLIQRLRGTS